MDTTVVGFFLIAIRKCPLWDVTVYVFGVESFAHIECYSDCSRKGNHLVGPLCFFIYNTTITCSCKLNCI